jgi:hypothetical protein
MGIVKKEDIAGYQRGDGTIVCTECATDEDTKGLTEDDILTDRQSNNEARGCCQRMGIRITILATVPPTICLKPLPSQPRERTHFRGMPHLLQVQLSTTTPYSVSFDGTSTTFNPGYNGTWQSESLSFNLAPGPSLIMGCCAPHVALTPQRPSSVASIVT